MNPRTLDAFVLLRGFVRSFPIALAIPPQPGWRLSRAEGIGGNHSEVIWGLGDPKYIINLLN